MGGVSISEKSHEVKRGILSLLESLKTKDQEDQHMTVLEDLFYRFKLWASNLGAFHQPAKKISLDYRLSDSPQIRDNIYKHLDDLNKGLDNCKVLCTTALRHLLIL